MICTFFGHRDAPESICASLTNQIEDLILHHGVNTFYYGNHGNFDAMVARELKKAKRNHPNISCILVLAYLPTQPLTDTETLFPEGIELVPKRFAISFRNRFMINASQFVIGYVQRRIGGAAQFFALAKKRGLKTINLAEISFSSDG